MNRLFRTSERTRLISSRLGSLLLLFQRSPIVQMLFPEARVLGGAGLGELAKWTVATVAGLGAYDTVAGATTVSQVLPNSGSANVTAAVGSSLSFTVQCTGAPGTPGSWTMSTVPGLTHSNSKNSATDSLSGIPTTEGTYSVVAKCWEGTNFNGGSSSKTFSMTVGPAIITTSPASTTIPSGSTTTLSVVASGSPLTYQWYVGTSGSGTAIAGATSASYTTPALTASNNYWVKVTRGTNSATSNTVVANSATAAISVAALPSFTTQPASVTINSGTTATLTAVATGATSYQWYIGASGTTTTPISGATSASYTPPAPAGTTTYWVRATNGVGSTNSAAATITVNFPAAITSQPASTTISSGTSTTLVVVASGTGPLTYQWYQGTSGVTTTPVGTNSSIYSTKVLTADTNFWVKVTNSSNPSGAFSDTAAVTIVQPAAITTNPASTVILSGESTTLSVVASGTGPLTYQWYQGLSGVTNTPVGNNSSSFTTPALNADTSYWVKVTNPTNTSGALSAAATINVTSAADTSDSDGDGLSRFEELITYHTDPNKADTDGDGLTDGQEVHATHTNPNLADSNTNGTSDANEDPDGDGLSNIDELNRFHTDPLLADSNSDGLSDAYAAAFVGTAIKPSVGNQVTFDLKNLGASGNTFKLVGKLPAGLTFSATSGLISGTITAAAGTYPVSVQILSGKTLVRTISIPIVVLPFPSSLIGNFESILENGSSIPIGAFKVSITGADAWTATLDSAGGATRKAKGSFVLAQGAPIAPITAAFGSNGSAPAITISVSLDGSRPTFTGTYNGGTVRGFKIASGSENPSSTTLCNLVLDPGTQNGDTVPAGLGTLKGSFSNLGVSTHKGMLGDGTAVTVSVKLSTTGQALLWAQPSTSKSTYLGGIITVNGIGQPANASAKLTDRVYWTKAADSKALSYPNGFPLMPVTVGSSLWAVPSNASALGASLGWRSNSLTAVTINGGGLSNSSPQATATLLPTEFSLDASFNLATSLPTGSPLVAWTGNATSADGGFTGTLTVPTGFSTAVLPGAAAVSGVLVQDDVWGTVTGCGLVKVPVSGIKGSFKTAAFVLGQ